MSDGKLRKRGPNTITAKKALFAELERVGAQGFAVVDQELATGLVAIAAPVREESRGVVAAINLAAHTSIASPEGLIDGCLKDLLSAAAGFSGELGFRGE